MSAHTPGPWDLDGSNAGCVWAEGLDGAPRLVAEVRRQPRRAAQGPLKRLTTDGDVDSLAEGKANARLIAAAPKLLTALKVLAEWGPLADSIDVAEFRIDVANALAAIAEAEGES